MDFFDEFEPAINLWGDGKTVEAVATSGVDDIFDFAETLALITRFHFTQEQITSKADTHPNNFAFVYPVE